MSIDQKSKNDHYLSAMKTDFNSNPISAISKSAIIIMFFLVPFFTSHAQEGLRAGTKAPAFELPDINGNKIALSSFLNKNIVVIHFWKSK